MEDAQLPKSATEVTFSEAFDEFGKGVLVSVDSYICTVVLYKKCIACILRAPHKSSSNLYVPRCMLMYR